MTAEKAALRETMKQQLRAITGEDRQSLSDEICEHVLQMTQWQEAQSVVLFLPLPSEPIIAPLKLDCDVRKVPEILIPQSPKDGLQLPEQIDLVLVPGLAFSKDRHRLGRGGGFFDRLLAGRAKNAFKLAICFSFQLVDAIPTEEHDVKVDAVVTEKRVWI
jgi:5-formyltetrahydrofolate cyclo-ligase